MFDPACPFTAARSVWCPAHPRPTAVVRVGDDGEGGSVLHTVAGTAIPAARAVPLPEPGELVSTPSGRGWFLGWSEVDRADGWLSAWIAATSWSCLTQISRPAIEWDARQRVLLRGPRLAAEEVVRLLGVTLSAHRDTVTRLLRDLAIPDPCDPGRSAGSQSPASQLFPAHRVIAAETDPAQSFLRDLIAPQRDPGESSVEAAARNANDERAQRAMAGVRAYADESYYGELGECLPTVLGDFMGDLRHACDAAGLSWSQVQRSGAYHYGAELRGEP